ncbi:MAG TPA: GerMN domain-containing protein [Bacillota bacterium]
MRRLTIPLLIILLLLAGVIGYSTRTGEVIKLRQQIELVEKQQSQPGVTDSPMDTVALFFVNNSKNSLTLKPVIVEIPRCSGAAKWKAVLEALFKGPPESSELLSIFPEGTKAISIEVKNGLATVNLNQQATMVNVGSEGEALAVASIVNTLTKLPEIFEVKILIEGEEVESLAGHVDLSETFRYNSQLVSFE